MSDIRQVIEQFIKDTSISPLLNKPPDLVETQMRAARIRAAIPKILRAFYEETVSLEELTVQFEELKAEWDAFECECTGSPDNQGNGDFIFDDDYHISGERNYVNTIYKTRFSYLPQSTNVYINGLRITRGPEYDYVETEDKTIQLVFPLFPADRIAINYLTSPENGNFVSDYDYHIIGVKDGYNTEYLLRSNYVMQSTIVYLNGLRLSRGVDYDYIESGGNKIIFNEPLRSTDLITVDYKTTNIVET